MRAYPDNARVRASVRAVIAGLPPPEPRLHVYSYGVVQRLVRLLPGRVEIAWKEIGDQTAFLDTLDLLVTSGETQGLEDTRISLERWFSMCRPAHTPTDLAHFVSLLEGASFSARVQAYLYERCELPVVYLAPAGNAIELPPSRPHEQDRDIDRRPFPIGPIMRRSLPPPRRPGRALINVALEALCARTLEIYPLIHANPGDVMLVPCGRGVEIALVGVAPEFRSALEALYFCMVLKNGVPIAYGPAGVFLGCCEMGINLFPEFRGGEIRYIYAQFMRVLHHVLGVEHFFVTRYGMGEGNAEAIDSGAFWFYRKLGFRATNPTVETLAREEEQRMAEHPGHRSDRPTLRRLSHTEASFDLSGGRCVPFDFGTLGIAVSRFIGREFARDRAAAEATCARRIARAIGVPGQELALRAMAPILCMIPDLPRWGAREKAALARIASAKSGRSEAPAARRFKAHHRLEAALRAIAGRPRDPADHVFRQRP